MEPVHCQFILNFWPLVLSLDPEILSGPLLRNYKWQMLHTFRAYQSDMVPVYGRVILTFDCPLSLKLWNLCPNLVGLLHIFMVPVHSSHFDTWLTVVIEIMTFSWNLFDQILSGPLHIYMAYQPDMIPVHSEVILTFNWPLSLKLWHLTEICLSKSCLGQYSEIIHDNCFILSEQINLAWNLCTVRLFWPSALKICPSP